MQTLHSLGGNALVKTPSSEPTVQGQGRGNLGSPPLRCSRAALRTRAAGPAPPPRVGTYSGRGGGGLRAVAGGVGSCPSAGIWDSAVPRRPGEWRCEAGRTGAAAVGCGSRGPASAPPGQGASGRARLVGSETHGPSCGLCAAPAQPRDSARRVAEPAF